MEIINRITNVGIASNLCYPSLQEYRRVCKIDKGYAIERLGIDFGMAKVCNKYVIKMANDQLFYNHDGSIWLIEKIIT